MQSQNVGLESEFESESYQTFPVQRLAYDKKKKTCKAETSLPVGIVISPDYKTFWKKRWFNFRWPRLSTVLDVLMLPIKYVSLIGPFIEGILNWQLTRVGLHLPPNIYFVNPFKTTRITENDIEKVQDELDKLQAKQEEIFAGRWRGFSILPQMYATSRKGKEKNNEPTITNGLLQVNAFLLNSQPNKLHINMHGLGSSGNSYDIVAPEAAEMWQADQWNVTRVPVASVEEQKEQVRQMIAAAIQVGYKDIRLDGYSYGAGLVRTVYHELMDDDHYRKFLAEKNITLHYTARNGYKSEGLTFFAYLTGFGEKDTPDYKKKGAHAPKPNWLMRIGHFFVHHILRIDTLRNRRLNRPIPETSHNYVVNAVLSVERDGKKTVMRDGVIGYTNRSNGKHHGHTCIDVDFTLRSGPKHENFLDPTFEKTEQKYNGYYTKERYASSSNKPVRRHWAAVMEPHLFRKANKKIMMDMELKNTLTEKAARRKVMLLQRKILLEEQWQVRGGCKINYDKGRIKKRIPAWAKKQLDMIREAYQEEKRVIKTRKGKTRWRATFFKLAEIGREGAEATSRYRYETTQDFYDRTKTASRLDRFTS